MILGIINNSYRYFMADTIYGALVTLKVVDTHHRRSPLIQGGLEIPVLVIVQMECTTKNNARYNDLVQKSYQEPVDGKFEDITDTILEDINNSSDEDTIDYLD